jgi:dihydrofolate reductase
VTSTHSEEGHRDDASRNAHSPAVPHHRRLKAAGGKNLEILSADVTGQCLRRGLVDEILVYVLPVLFGDGIRFSSPGLGRIDLELVSSTRSGAVTILRFRVRK